MKASPGYICTYSGVVELHSDGRPLRQSSQRSSSIYCSWHHDFDAAGVDSLHHSWLWREPRMLLSLFFLYGLAKRGGPL
jgi:hypothetical protein